VDYIPIIVIQYDLKEEGTIEATHGKVVKTMITRGKERVGNSVTAVTGCAYTEGF
jgi:hypothetical protein